MESLARRAPIAVRGALILGLAAILAGCGSAATPAASPSSDAASPSPAASVATAASSSAPASPVASSAASPGPDASVVSGWAATGSMIEARQVFTATRLLDGRVLVAGGATEDTALASAELYDPASGAWTTTGSMGEARVGHTATLLPDGRVLVAGGAGGAGSGALASAELYDPASGAWTATGAMGEARVVHTATLLPDGRVLVAGGAGDVVGFESSSALASAELYDAASGSWTATGAMTEARRRCSATMLLAEGKVLVAGGVGSDGITGRIASAELFDPASGSWTLTGSMTEVRESHTATLLLDGKVLVAGGVGSDGGGVGTLASAELYDPTTRSWTTTGSMARPHQFHTATLLDDGTVLVVGGSAELYDPATRSWSETSAMVETRAARTATLLLDGTVLVAGGYGGGPVAAAELYEPGDGG